MMTFPAYAANFEAHPKEGNAHRHLSPILSRLARVEFSLRVVDPAVNQGQMDSDFDDAFEKVIHVAGATVKALQLPPGVPQELDFTFAFEGCVVAVEIEKANREKILRDILKCHMYLRAGADFALIALPRNYCHSHGIWNLYDFGIQRYDECLTYGFGTADNLGRILLLGYDQFDALTNEALTPKIRERMRQRALKGIVI